MPDHALFDSNGSIVLCTQCGKPLRSYVDSVACHRCDFAHKLAEQPALTGLYWGAASRRTTERASNA